MGARNRRQCPPRPMPLFPITDVHVPNPFPCVQVVSHTTVVTQAMDRRTPELLREVARIPISKFILSNDTAAALLALISCCPERW